MATLKCIIVLVLAISTLSVGSSRAAKDGYVRNPCVYTRFPALCLQSLTGLGSGNQTVDVLSVLVNRTIFESRLPDHGLISSHFVSPAGAQLTRMAVDECNELMEMSLKRLNQALDLLQKSPSKHKADVQTLLSAALTFQQTCKDVVEDHVPSNSYIGELYKKMEYLSELGSNPLALVNRIAGNPTGKSPPGHRVLERQGFPGWVSVRDRKLLQSSEIKADVVVAKDGSGNFKTVSEAIEAAGGGRRFVIYVKSGTYNEKINTNKDGITLIGDGKYSTIITGGSSVAKGSSLRGSATFTITGDGFIARDIGFENTAGAEGHQAVALTVSSDNSVLFRCSIAGYQDTLYALALRQFYRECDIYGTVDFIFGNAAAVFQSCNLVLRRPRSGGAFNAILANGRSDPGQNTGFSVQNCKITVGSDFSPVRDKFNSYLGRPWKPYSRAVVMQSNIDGEISARGWVEWEGAGGSTYKTLYFAEYENMGPGAGTSGRVNWAGFQVIGTPEATKFTVASFIGGNSWLPSTGVTFVAGLH
ncbi:putative pectinesterase/pectinesterase inhibitor 54 [Sesamum angolense]|uniref:Pectinesterase n=1 Tax=Sesamum angolense TaxID=2727404 RepID=A0AAE1WEP2_9LAMI|nr:putative pectinesterase/pectinesterase inhibitor 54 [Sesamum angolense]